MSNEPIYDVNTKTAAIAAARAVIRGDVQRARELLIGWRSFSVCEARAMIGACREAGRRYGIEVSWTSFLRRNMPAAIRGVFDGGVK